MRKVIFAIIFVLLMTYGADYAYSAATDHIPDSVITTTVKAALLKEPGVKSGSIHVETEKGVVLLQGKVYSLSEKTHIEKVVNGCIGVRGVFNKIEVSK